MNAFNSIVAKKPSENAGPMAAGKSIFLYFSAINSRSGGGKSIYYQKHAAIIFLTNL